MRLPGEGSQDGGITLQENDRMLILFHWHRFPFSRTVLGCDVQDPHAAVRQLTEQKHPVGHVYRGKTEGPPMGEEQKS